MKHGHLTLIFSLFSALAFTQTRIESPHGALDIACEQCHSTSGWTDPSKFGAYPHPSFALEGAHQRDDCASCHRSLVFSEVSATCVACHEDTHQGKLGGDCASCHTPVTWAQDTKMRDRHEETAFPLVGVHARLSCDACHALESSEEWTRLSTDCASCHSSAFEASLNPNHRAANFGLDCKPCHQLAGPDWSAPAYVHPGAFPLEGGHAGPDCVACHTTVYAGTPTDCYSCHANDFNATTAPNHREQGFPTDCTTCHETAAWTPAEFDHAQTGFLLTGGHAIDTCISCHADGYVNTPTDCISCHRDSYEATTNPNHVAGAYPTTCESCHTTAGWQPAAFDHSQTQFQLTGGHALSDCLACHSEGYSNTPTDCVACHRDDYTAVTDPNHVTGQFPTTCESCHVTTGWEPATFDHNQTSFPLTGGHNLSNCLACHSNGYTNTPTDCVACHRSDYDTTADPNHVTSNFPTTCETCHVTTGWEPATFDHSQTSFPLTGGHNLSNCLACHSNGYTNTPTDCVACHRSDYDTTADPNHVTSNFPTTCETCHVTTGWEPATFDHSQTSFPLTGGHNLSNCLACHSNGYTNTPTDCVACHQDDYTAVTDPNHVTSNFPTTCETCHVTTGWEPATFDHNQTSFPLTGGHNLSNCLACHSNGYTNTPTDCVACHQDDYTAVTDPNHVTSNFPTTCETCHVTTGWEPATFDHNQTSFPLTGGHNLSNCLACHSNGYTNTPTDCVACHQDDYTAVTDPNHVTSNFPTTCETCHVTTGWEPATFDHNQTSFPLTGGHNLSNCLACHSNGYTNTPTDCVACHRDDYTAVTDPNHVTSNFPTTCETCHVTTGWEPATFDHNQTSFPLTGGHNLTDCLACHSNGYTNTPTDCVACHQDDYNAVTDPNHVTSNFPTTCETCHVTTGWEPATFDHNQTGFPLTGGHNLTDCLACHSNGYTNTPTDCVACHQDDYNAVTDPNHVTSNFPTTCETCHVTTGWEPANFDHNQTGFPLTFGHNLTDCLACHSNGYTNTPTDCIACHQTDYTNAEPNHASAGFPTDCTLCHSTRGWEGATFNHAFPIYSGSHAGTWDTCADCHVTPNTFTSFECINCHEHNQQEMDEEHDGVSGYVYQSQSCYTCHPTGEED